MARNRARLSLVGFDAGIKENPKLERPPFLFGDNIDPWAMRLKQWSALAGCGSGSLVRGTGCCEGTGCVVQVHFERSARRRPRRASRALTKDLECTVEVVLGPVPVGRHVSAGIDLQRRAIGRDRFL